MAWRTPTYGTTVGSTTSRKPGCVHPPEKLVSNNVFFIISTRQCFPPKGNILELRQFFRSRNVFLSSEWLKAVQVLMVISVVFSSVSFLVFLGQLFTMSKGGLFYFTGLCQVFAGNSEVKQCPVNMPQYDDTI